MYARVRLCLCLHPFLSNLSLSLTILLALSSVSLLSRQDVAILRLEFVHLGLSASNERG